LCRPKPSEIMRCSLNYSPIIHICKVLTNIDACLDLLTSSAHAYFIHMYTLWMRPVTSLWLHACVAACLLFSSLTDIKQALGFFDEGVASSNAVRSHKREPVIDQFAKLADHPFQTLGSVVIGFYY